MLAVRDRLADDDVEVVVVTFTTTALALRYVGENHVGVPVLLDPDREVYRAYGLGRAGRARVWNIATLRTYAALLRSRRWRLRRPTEDIRQLGGDFVVDAEGILRWAYRSSGPDDRPSPDAIVQAVSTQAP